MSGRFLAALLLAFQLLTAELSAELPAEPLGTLDGDALIAELAGAALELQNPRRIHRQQLRLGDAALTLDDGLAFPVRTPSGRLVEVVFVGRGSVELAAADAIEAAQLELFTGEERLRETFTEAVFAFAETTLLGDPQGAPTSAFSDAARRAASRFAAWRTSPERTLHQVEAGLLRGALGDDGAATFRSAWLRGERLGDFVIHLDADAEEPLRVGQLVPAVPSGDDRRRWLRILHRGQRRGRILDDELAELATWDTWTATRNASTDAGGAPFEARHYRLDATVRPQTGTLTGHASIELEAVAGGRRAVRLDLHRDLELAQVRLGEQPLAVLRDGAALWVVLPAAPDAGHRLKLEVGWHGTFLDRERQGSWALRDALAWYPHAGRRDRATYDVVLRRPAGYDLLAGGRWVASGKIDGMRWDRRKLESPAVGFSFEVGRFEIHKIRAGHVAVTAAYDPRLIAASGDSLRQITSTVADALLFFEEAFGPYPLDELVVVTVPRDVSQAMPGFITLANGMMLDWGSFGGLLGLTDRRAVVAHEVAHQWWGHAVGWRGERDRWISEATANYAAHLFTRHRLDLDATGPTAGWQDELGATTADGRPIESLGPLVLGHRLDSSRSHDAYDAIVYRKGAVVLGMLELLLGGEEPFLAALRQVVAARRGGVLSTEGFLELLEERTGTHLGAFSEQFIYGTGLPEIYYTYEVEERTPGRWQVRLAARQTPPYRFEWAVVDNGRGHLDVERRRRDQLEVATSRLLAPFEVSFPDSTVGLRGQMEIAGEESEVVFELDRRPDEVRLDAHHEVFGRFFNQRRHPKRVLLYRGFDLAAAGRRDEAESLLVEALGTRSVEPDASHPLGRFNALADRLIDAQIHLELARLQLDRGRDGDARRRLDEALRALEAAESPWIAGDVTLLEARLAIRRGDHRQAFRQLRHEILEQRRLRSTEGYLLLAIAARETGRAAVFERAVRAARAKGADVSRLLPEPP